MRVSVAFNNVTFLVPCGDGSCTVAELINKAITRYKKHVNKPPEYEVKVKNLRMANGSGYIDNDDIVSEVLADMEFVIADFEESNGCDSSSNVSFDLMSNYGQSGVFLSGTAASVTSNDIEEQTPVMDRPDRPYSLLDEANLGEMRQRRWSESQSESEPRESPANDRLPQPLRERFVPRQRSTWSNEHFSSVFPRSSWESSLEVIKRKGYPFSTRRMEAFANRPRYPNTGSLLDSEDLPPLDPNLYRSFAQHGPPSRYRPGGSLYRPRSQDILGTDELHSVHTPSFSEYPESDIYSESNNYYLSQPAFSGGYESTRNHYLPSGYSLSQPGPARHVSFSEKPSELGPRDHHDRPSSLSNTSQNAMRTLREEPGEVKSSDDEKPLEDIKSESESTVSDKEYGPFDRSTRKSIRDGPVLEQWANTVEDRHILDDQDSELTINGDESELQDISTDQGQEEYEPRHDSSTLTRSMLTSPTPNYEETVSSETEELENDHKEEELENDHEEVELSNICIIELHKGNKQLGLQLSKHKTPEGRDAGIFIAALDESGFAAESKNLQVNDRILACNGADFTKISNDRALEKLAEMMEEPMLRIALSRPVEQSSENQEETRPDQPPSSAASNAPLLSNTSSNTRQLGRLYNIDLTKGSCGLGFSLTSRDIAANDGERLIYVKSVTPGGVAFEDGRLKIGDRLVKVNDEDISGYTRPEVAELLRNCQGKVVLCVSRQGETYDDGEIEATADTPIAIGKTVLSLNIVMADSSSAELGITVQGRVNVANHTQNTNFGVDAGVYVSTIIPGCAAAYDGRLQVGDQLLSVNGQSLVGKTNDNALETLRKALAQNRPEIQLVIARKVSRKSSIRHSDSQVLNDDSEEVQPSREVGIDVGPSHSSHGTSGYGCSQGSYVPSQGSYSHSQGGTFPSQNSYYGSQNSYIQSQESLPSLDSPAILRKNLSQLSEDSVRSDQEIVLKDPPLKVRREDDVLDGRKEDYSLPSTNGHVQKKKENHVARVNVKVQTSSSCSSLSQGSERGMKHYNVPNHSSSHGVLSPTMSDSGQSGVVSPSSVDMVVNPSPTRRRGSFGRGSSMPGKSPSPSHSRHQVESKYTSRITSSPLASPSPPNGHAPQRHMSFSEGRTPVIAEEDRYHSTTIPRSNKPRPVKVEMESQESLGPSDDEGNAAFQRDGPGRISIKKGKGAPKNLPNVAMLNAEPKLEGDGTSLVGHEMSRSVDDLLTQESRDTGVDMSLSVDSLQMMSSQGYSQEDPSGLTRNNEGRSSLRRAVDKSLTERCSSEGRDPQIADIRGAAVLTYGVGDYEDKKKKGKKKTFLKIFKTKRGKKGRDRNESSGSGPTHSRQYSLDEATGEVQMRQKTPSASKLAAHHRFSLSVLDDPVSEVVANV